METIRYFVYKIAKGCKWSAMGDMSIGFGS